MNTSDYLAIAQVALTAIAFWVGYWTRGAREHERSNHANYVWPPRVVVARGTDPNLPSLWVIKGGQS